MSEAQNPFEYGSGANPYGVAPANNVSLAETQRHDMGNVGAANTEARTVAEVKAQVLMSRQFPRDPRSCMERILRECERPTLAEKATYTFPRGKETVSGPSIRLAEMMTRNWGNCTTGLEVLERKVDGRGIGTSVLRAFAWDLETNAYFSMQFEVKHWRQTQGGGYKLTEDRDIYELEANMGARRKRACMLQMIPGDVTQVAVDKCRMVASQGIVAAMQNKAQRADLIAKTVKVFEKMGVIQSDIEDCLSAKMSDWNADHMLRLKEIKNGLDDNVLSIGEIFPRLSGLGGNDKITKEQVEELMKLIAETGRQREISDALKVIGFAKVADVTAVKLDEVRVLISGFVEKTQKPPSTAPSPDTSKPTDKPVQTSL